eukprot:2824266-Lingulodinium_polyedra.AAC.1
MSKPCPDHEFCSNNFPAMFRPFQAMFKPCRSHVQAICEQFASHVQAMFKFMLSQCSNHL